MTESTIGEPARRDHIAGLLRRYPALAADETRDLLDFLKRGAILDIGMLKASPDAAAAIARVERDHSAHFRATPIQRLTVVALLTLPVLLMCWLAWYWGTK